ncbi:MAG: hypothetical protein Q8J88_17130 [Bacteroidales bacterium]|nr:hypothetical protein [Bacteroidales bacterium]
MDETTLKTNKTKYLILSVQSLSLFLITYYLAYFISGLSVLYIAYDFDIPARLYINNIHFGLSDDSPLWTSDATISVFMATPVSSFVVGIVSIFIFMIKKKKTALYLFASIWIFLQAFNMTFGLLSENLITQTGLIKVAQEMGLRSIMIILTIGLSLFFLVKSGILAAKLFYTHLDCNFISEKSIRGKLAFYFFFLPWMAGSVIIIFLAGESVDKKDFIMAGFMLLLLLPSLFVSPPKQKELIYINKKPALILPFLALLVIVASGIILKDGISF